MHNRSAKLLSAAGAGVIASLAVAATVPAPARADTCLSAPNAPTPAGSHWFYRTDHANKRKCWYLRKVDATPAAAPADADAADGASAEAAPAPSVAKPKTATASGAAQPASVSQPTPSPLSPSVADARAEYAAPQQPRNAAPAAANSPFPDPVLAAPAEATQQAAAPAPQTAPAKPPVTMKERWSEPTAANMPGATDATDRLRKAAKATAKAAPVASTDAAMSAGTIATLIGALLAALAVAGGIAAALVKFGRSEPVVRRDASERPDLWAGHSEPIDAGMYADDFRASPIDLDAPADAAIAQDQRPVPVQESEPPAWIRAARERHVANDTTRPSDAPAQRPAGDNAQPSRAPEASRAPAREPAPVTDEIEQLLALAQKRSAA